MTDRMGSFTLRNGCDKTVNHLQDVLLLHPLPLHDRLESTGSLTLSITYLEESLKILVRQSRYFHEDVRLHTSSYLKCQLIRDISVVTELQFLEVEFLVLVMSSSSLRSNMESRTGYAMPKLTT